MEMELVPLRLCGEFKAGESFSAAALRLGARVRPFKKSPFSKSEALAANDGTFVLYFDADNACNGLELFAGYNHVISYRGINLFPKLQGDFVNQLNSIECDVTRNDYGFECISLGVTTFSPDFGDDSDDQDLLCKIDSVFVKLVNA